jgi:hypothetical protein
LDQAVWHWGLQYAKFAVTAAMFTLGLRKRLLARRFSPLSAEEEAAYSRCIETIRGVRLTAARDIGNG